MFVLARLPRSACEYDRREKVEGRLLSAAGNIAFQAARQRRTDCWLCCRRR